MAASFLNEGKATGVDIWSTSDQSGNQSIGDAPRVC